MATKQKEDEQMQCVKVLRSFAWSPNGIDTIRVSAGDTLDTDDLPPAMVEAGIDAEVFDLVLEEAQSKPVVRNISGRQIMNKAIEPV